MASAFARHIELISVAPDHVVVSFRTPRDEVVRVQVTPLGFGAPGATVSMGAPAVADPLHDYHWARVDGLSPNTAYRIDVDGAPRSWRLAQRPIRTLRRPPGAPVARIAMTNDVHFGEAEAGRIEQLRRVPIAQRIPGLRTLVHAHRMPDGLPNHARMMSAHAVADIQEWNPDLVVVKGDLTSNGRPEQYQEFEEIYEPLLDRLVAFRGNHDSKLPEDTLPHRFFSVALDGVTVAVLDTVVRGRTHGAVDRVQIEWLREQARMATQPLIVVGHHNLDVARSGRGPGRSFHYGVNTEDSRALLEVFEAEPAIVGYFAGHTHRNFVGEGPRGIPIVETASAKEFPGTWAAYELHSGGYLQTLYQVRAPEALAWSIETKKMFFGLAPVFSRGRVTDRGFTYDYDRVTRQNLGGA